MNNFSVGILGGSALGTNHLFCHAAINLAKELSKLDCEIICCGGATGLIGEFIAHHNNAQNIHAYILNQELKSTSSLIENVNFCTNTSHRKSQILEKSDLIIALPGGLGTFDELFSFIAAQKIGEHTKPIILLNIAKFYNPLIAIFENLVTTGFLKKQHLARVNPITSVDGVAEITLDILKSTIENKK